MSAAELRRIDVGGAGLAVEIAGRGPALLLLHGFTGSAETMRAVASELARGYRTISVDLLGHGRSDAPRDPSRYALECTAGDLARVLDALGESRAHVLGYSLGGRIALGLAALRPQRVRSALLIGASAGIADPAERAARRRADEALAESLEVDGLESFVTRWMALPLFASQARLGADFLARAREARLRNSAHGHAHPPADVRRSLAFGLLHGLAGSAAILVLLVAAAPTRGAQLAYFLAFGTGTGVGMLGVSLALAGLVKAASRHGASWARALHLGAAAASILAGAVLAVTTARQLLYS